MDLSKERYENLDGMRGYACIGIVLMHVLVNGDFGQSGFIFEKLIPSFTNFTYLFMILSAFSMCCGYYEKFISGQLDLERFYIRRYQRIWPFFALLCTIELIIDHNLNSLYEWFADITLAFGLIQNHGISIVGVGWFLGVVFVFYMLFPFLVFLLRNIKRAWIMMAVTVVMNILCHLRFEETVGRTNFIFSAMFFAAGGIIYLYRDRLSNARLKWVLVVTTIGAIVFFYTINGSDYTMLVLFSLIAVDGIVSNGKAATTVFRNKVIKYFGSISMEVYLCHMFVYRMIEKLNMKSLISNQKLCYVLIAIITIIGAMILAIVLKKVVRLVEKKLKAA